MEWLDTFYYMILGLVLRFAIPISITGLIIIWLRWLDGRWQEEAEKYIRLVGNVSFWEGRTPCWDAKNCSPERRNSCPAYQNGQKACWQVLSEQDGRLKDECLGCNVFLDTAAPVAA